MELDRETEQNCVGKDFKLFRQYGFNRGQKFGLPCDVVALLGEEAELLHVALDLGLELGQVLGAAALHLLVVVEQDVGNVLVVIALLVMCLKMEYFLLERKPKRFRGKLEIHLIKLDFLLLTVWRYLTKLTPHKFFSHYR